MSSLHRNVAQPQFFCSICSRYFKEKTELDIHIRDHLGERHPSAFLKLAEPYVCNNCHEVFEIKSDLLIHCNTVCFDSPYMCKHCKLFCHSAVYLQLHLKYKHNYSDSMLREATQSAMKPLLSLPTFKNEVNQKDSLGLSGETSEQSTSKKKVYASTVSSSQNKSSKSKNKVQPPVYNLRKKDYVCGMCDASFSRKCVLDVHIQNHDEDDKLLYLSEHTRTQENESGSKIEDTSSAKVVEEYFSTEDLKPSTVVLGSSIWKHRAGEDHVRVLDAPKLQKTKKKRAKKPLALRKRKKKMKTKKRQSVKMSFSCEICNKIFKDNYKLRRHFLIHTGSRPYSCTKCKKAFTRVDHLKRHSFICPTVAEATIIHVKRARKLRSLK